MGVGRMAAGRAAPLRNGRALAVPVPLLRQVAMREEKTSKTSPERCRMKTTTFRSSVWMLCLAGALVAPASLVAQSPDPGSLRTHVVRPGDTLWELAERYLGSGYRWREILAVNARLVGGPRQLEVGQTLRIPRPGPDRAGRVPRRLYWTVVRPRGHGGFAR